MKIAFDYWMLKFKNFKVIGVFFIILIYQFTMFFELVNNYTNYNFYDLLIRQFGYLTLFYSISLFYLMIMYNLCERSNFYKYLFLRYKSKGQVYNLNVIATFFAAVCIVIFMNVIAFVECFSRVSFKNIWSPYFFYMMKGEVNVAYTDEIIKNIATKLSPFTYVIFNNIFVVLYLFALGMIFLVSNIYFEKRAFSLILVIIINVFNMCADSVNGIIGRLTFTSNVYLSNLNKVELIGYNFIIFRICYWILLIAILFFLGKLANKKSDYGFGN